jgi:nucleoside-diphosphate-sugar epimerase
MGEKRIISLLGCGWLGFPLAKRLISNGFPVMATTATPAKLKLFEAEGIDPFLVQFSRAVQICDLKKFLNADTLIITIPPGRLDPQGFDNYSQMVDFVCNDVPNSNISHLILVSSTSVYADNNATVNEFSAVLPNSESGKLLAETETRLQGLALNFISLRLAGLIGPGRMPGKFFAGKSLVPNGLAPVNLIHLNDAIGIILCLIDRPYMSGIFNGCAPTHPTREEFYTLAAEVECLQKPTFKPERTSWKTVSGTRTANDLNYSFEIPDLLDWLQTRKAD